MIEVFYDANSNRLVLDGLTAEESPGDGDYIDDATVTASIFNGSTVVTGAEDVALSPTGSGGRYEKVFAADDLDLVVGRKYRAVVTAVDGSDQLEIDTMVRVDRRQG